MGQEAEQLETPILHLNGTGAKQLLDQYRAAAETVGEALHRMQEAAPHPRDYYPKGDDSWKRAHAQHDTRCKQVRRVYDDLRALFENISRQQDERDTWRQKACSSAT